jgi:hypothetical protein
MPASDTTKPSCCPSEPPLNLPGEAVGLTGSWEAVSDNRHNRSVSEEEGDKMRCITGARELEGVWHIRTDDEVSNARGS